MKNLSFLCAILMFTGLYSTEAFAQFRNSTASPSNANSGLDTVRNQPVQLLLAPALQTFAISDTKVTDPSAKNKFFRFSNAAKLFLGLGADLIRGNTEDIPMYSLEEAWKYPGPTVRYPETATEYELFLERYQRYTSDK